MFKKTLLAAVVLMLSACDRGPQCLKDEKDIGTVLDIDEQCSYTKYSNCASTYQRLRIKRSDDTVCVMNNYRMMFKPGDKIRGPM